MKIAIVWSHSTWKSSLLDASDLWLPKIQEVARDVMWIMGKKPQDMKRQELLEFQQMIYDVQIGKEDLNVSFISDRWVYDNLAYAKVVSEELFLNLFAYTAKYHKGYDHVFYLPIEFKLVDDWIRFTDTKFQKQIDKSIIQIMDTLWVEYTTTTWSIEERVSKIKNRLDIK